MRRNNIGFESRGGERSSLNMAVERAQTEVGLDEEHTSSADPSPPKQSNTRLAQMDELTVQQGAGGHAAEAARRRGRGHKDRDEKDRREGQSARRDGRGVGDPRQDGRPVRDEKPGGRMLDADPSGSNRGLMDDRGAGQTRGGGSGGLGGDLMDDRGAGQTRGGDSGGLGGDLMDDRGAGRTRDRSSIDGSLRDSGDGAGRNDSSVLGNLLDIARDAGAGADGDGGRKGGPEDVRSTTGSGGIVSRTLNSLFGGGR